ncbi:MAG: SUMF1/EgtB/PvdO family nonheme iron enzyme [Planctomycetes bacterium]|nr:SUMF1/EgtB/PvdO family nonheme iron enzyme [Planctomycetota bacterium]
MRNTTKHASRAILLAIPLALAACGSTRSEERTTEAAAAAPARAPQAADGAAVAQTPAAAPALERLAVLVPGTTAQLVLAPIPGSDGAPPFLCATTEITWDMYDAFVFAMERAESEQDPPDAFARPSKPYILMDRGFGHAGYPVISVSFRGASEFCRWLSAKTGRRFRLPTETEWERAARGGVASAEPDTAALEAVAWYAANSKAKGRASTRPVGRKAANGYGLHDVLGNAAEWAVGPDGTGVLRGGSFRDPAEALTFAARVPDDAAFNATDPQVPKSVWWLADGPFAGFRIVCDP